jgi:hypothetical protein
VLRAERISDNRARMLVSAPELRAAEHGLRFAGRVCGRPFVAGQQGRLVIGAFAARFYEQLSVAAALPALPSPG